MLPLRYAPQWRIAGLGMLLAVLFLTLAPVTWVWPGRDELQAWLAHADKWAHMTTFLLLAVWFSGQYRPGAYWRIALGLFMFGTLIEAGQQLVGYRSAEWGDLAADVTGILLGLGIALSGVGGWSLRIESWFDHRQS